MRIRIMIRIRIEVKSCIRIRLETNADPCRAFFLFHRKNLKIRDIRAAQRKKEKKKEKRKKEVFVHYIFGLLTTYDTEAT
jgi:hypothetical protein